MKKIAILVLLCLFMTGCTIVRIDTQSIDNTIGVVLSKNNKLYNRIGKGYKYYVPRGVSYLDTNELNDTLYSSGDYYYLYIDAVGYYHQKKNDYVEDSNAYYSRKIEQNDKSGYLEINEQNGLYFVEFMYNYAKIEALVSRSNLNQMVLNASYILSTVKFNNNIIKLMLDEDFLKNKEETYDIFTSKKQINTSLQTADKTGPGGENAEVDGSEEETD